MPRYFFHLVKGSEVIAHDVTGDECANDYAAQKLARRGDGLTRLGKLPAYTLKQYHIEVRNEVGQTIVTVPFSDLTAV